MNYDLVTVPRVTQCSMCTCCTGCVNRCGRQCVGEQVKKEEMLETLLRVLEVSCMFK